MEKYKSPGRREIRKELDDAARFLPIGDGPSKRVKMASRKTRRAKQGENFRPVYGYLGAIPSGNLDAGNRHERRGLPKRIRRELADQAALWVRIGVRILRFATQHGCVT